jgi:HrpA-like RNA helicase
MAEINLIYNQIQNKNIECHCLHSSLSAEEQRNAFKRPQRGKRKSILSTNIAETSVTIDGIIAVIDTGRMKQIQHDEKRNMSRLVECWASKASLKQRKGRAGRVKDGAYYALYSKETLIKRIHSQDTPEIKRLPLTDTVLQLYKMELNPFSLLSNSPEPPSNSQIQNAIEALDHIGAIEQGDLTPLGNHLANLPVDPKLGKMLVLGCVLKCIDPCLTIAASLTDKGPFLQGEVADGKRKKMSSPSSSGIASGQVCNLLFNFLSSPSNLPSYSYIALLSFLSFSKYLPFFAFPLGVRSFG